LIALFFLVKTAFERTTSFINDHKHSMVHELDRSFLDDIYTTQRQLHFLENNHMHDEKIAHEISDIKKQLAVIEEKYKTNSPGIMLLGPIGSAAIIAKEEKLQKKLLKTVNDINKILFSINNAQDTHIPFQTIDTGINHNRKLMQTLIV
jgi:tRNA G26 N,N-dimethylase Trm1